MFCPKVSCAFATSACSPTATVQNYSGCAVPSCRPSPHHRSGSALHISVNTVAAAPCEWWKHSLPPNCPPGCPTHPKRRTLHDPPLRRDAMPRDPYYSGRNLDPAAEVSAILASGAPSVLHRSLYSPNLTRPTIIIPAAYLSLRQLIPPDLLYTPFPDIIQNT